jgi:hypothetical protein
MNHMRKLLLVAFSCIAVSAACAGNPPSDVPRRDANLITQAEVRSANAANAYELVQQLRPLWLQSRGERSTRMGTSILVYVNNARWGDIQQLRSLSTDAIVSLRYLDGNTASNTLPGIGAGHVEGAIVITLSTGS